MISLEKHLSLAHAEIMSKQVMWYTLPKKMIKTVQEADQKYIDEKLCSRRIVQEQLDSLIQKEGNLLEDIIEHMD